MVTTPRGERVLDLTHVGERHALPGSFSFIRLMVEAQHDSCVGTMIGWPFAGCRMLLVDIISTRASSWASRRSGT